MKTKLLLLTAISFSGSLLTSCSFFNSIKYLKLDNYVLENKVIEYQNIYFQKSNLGYIATGLINKNVEVVDIPSKIYEEDGEYVHQHEIYAFGKDFISNNEYIKEIHLNTYNTVAYKNAIYNLSNLTKFIVESPVSNHFSVLVEKSAIDISENVLLEAKGSSFLVACKYFPEDLYRISLSEDFKVRIECFFVINHQERYIQNYMCYPRLKYGLFKEEQGKSYGDDVLEGEYKSADSTFKIAHVNGYIDYFLLGEGKNEKLKNKNFNDIYITLTMAFNIRYEERHNAQIDIVKRHNITSQYVVTKGLYPSGKIEKDNCSLKYNIHYN